MTIVQRGSFGLGNAHMTIVQKGCFGQCSYDHCPKGLFCEICSVACLIPLYDYIYKFLRSDQSPHEHTERNLSINENRTKLRVTKQLPMLPKQKIITKSWGAADDVAAGVLDKSLYKPV